MRCQAECLRGGAAASFARSNIDARRRWNRLWPEFRDPCTSSQGFPASQAADAHSRAPERPLRRRQDAATLAHRNAQPG